MAEGEAALILRLDDLPSLKRPGGQVVTPILGRWSKAETQLWIGAVSQPPGTGDAPSEAGLHTHPVEEALLVFEGEAIVLVDGVTYVLKAGDVAWVPAGVVHGLAPGKAGLRSYSIYASPDPTRTMAQSGAVFQQTSDADLRELGLL